MKHRKGALCKTRLSPEDAIQLLRRCADQAHRKASTTQSDMAYWSCIGESEMFLDIIEMLEETYIDKGEIK